MHAAKIYPALLAFFAILRPISGQNTTTVTPILTPIFTAQVYLGALVGPIPIYGGAQVGKAHVRNKSTRTSAMIASARIADGF